MNSRTCTGEDGTSFTITNMVLRGEAQSSEPRLAGTLVLRTHSVVNTATGDGWLNGTWSSRNGASGRAWARLSAVIDDSTHVDGLASGRVHRPWGHLRGNFSAAIGNASMIGNLGANATIAPDNSALIFRGC